MADPLFHATAPSPLGPLLLVGSPQGLRSLSLRGPHPDPAPPGQAYPAPFAEALRQLAEYFRGSRTAFDLPLDPRGTPFQRQAWSSLLSIPYGSTHSYATQAAALGRPSAARAFGAACARNPLLIVLPCHRVVAAQGALTGYRGGLAAKAWLLAHESLHRP